MRTVAIDSKLHRDDTLDVIKGIGIILVVVGHCFFSFTSYIYLFHMPLFFMVSGYLWDDRKATSLQAVKNYIISKLKHLWFPFVLCNSVFSLLNNFFLRTGIYSNDPLFPELYPGNVLSPYFDIPTLCFEILKHICFLGDTQLGTATWFLRTLFFVSVVHAACRYLAKSSPLGEKFYSAAVLIALAGTIFFNATDFGLPGSLQSCFPGYVAFWLGTKLKARSDLPAVKKPSPVLSVISFVALLILNSHGSVSVSSGKITGLLFYITVSLLGWFLVYPIALHFPKQLKTVIAYIGKRSLSILILHYLAFKAVTFCYLYATGGNMLGLAKFPVFGHVTWLKIVYSLAGIVLPLFAEHLYSRFKNHIINNCHITAKPLV